MKDKSLGLSVMLMSFYVEIEGCGGSGKSVVGVKCRRNKDGQLKPSRDRSFSIGDAAGYLAITTSGSPTVEKRNVLIETGLKETTIKHLRYYVRASSTYSSTLTTY